MSITDVTTKRGDPRELVSPEVFRKIVNYVAEHHEVTHAYAERMFTQLLIWFLAVAENPHVRLAMDATVDPAWHAFILHSQDYRDFCNIMYGEYLHHVPPAPGTSHSDEEINRTLPALRATGYDVDEEFWSGQKPCCPPNPCVSASRSNCKGQTGAPPPVST